MRIGTIIIITLCLMPIAYASGSAPPADATKVLYLKLNNNSAIGENATLAVDSSTFSNNGTIFGTPLFNATGGILTDGAYYFNGTGQYLNISNAPSLTFSGNVTFNIWFQNVRPSGRFLSKRNSTDLNYIFGLDSAGKLFFQNSGLSSSLTTSPSAYSSNPAWRMASAVYNGTHVNLYINGALVVSNASTGTLGSGNGPLFMGRDFNAGSQLNGTVDEISIYNKSMSSDDILTMYNNYIGECTSTLPNDDCTLSTSLTLDGANHQLNDSAVSGAIQVNANGVTLDCNGSKITGNWSGGTGTGSQNKGIRTFGFDNLTIKNCFFSGYHQGLLLGNAGQNLTILNVSLNNTYYSAYIGQEMQDIYFYNNTFYNTTHSGVYSPTPTGSATFGLNNLQVVNNSFSSAQLRPVNVKGRNSTLLNVGINISRNTLANTESVVNNDSDTVSDGTITVHYTYGATIEHMSVQGNRTKFTSPFIINNVHNLVIDNVTSKGYQYGFYYIRGGKTLVGTDWICTEVSQNLTVKNSNFSNNDIGLWLDAGYNINVYNNNFDNNTNSVDAYNNGVFLGVCTDNTHVYQNNFTRVGSKGLYGVSTNNVTVNNNYFSVIPSASASTYGYNNLYDYPVAISFEVLYGQFVQSNYTGFSSDANISFMSSLTSKNILIYNNTFSSDTTLYLKGEGMVNVSQDLTNSTYKSFQFPSTFINRTELYLNPSFTQLQTYTSGVLTDYALISYRLVSYKARYYMNTQYTRIDNVNVTQTYVGAFFNQTNTLVYYNNGSVACSNINACDGIINVTLPPSNYTYSLDNYSITQGTSRTGDPIGVSGSGNVITLTSSLTDTLYNVSITVLSTVTPNNPTIVYGDASSSSIGNYTYDGTYLTWTGMLTGGTNTLTISASEAAQNGICSGAGGSIMELGSWLPIIGLVLGASLVFGAIYLAQSGGVGSGALSAIGSDAGTFALTMVVAAVTVAIAAQIISAALCG